MVIAKPKTITRRAVTHALKGARRDVILAAAQSLFCERAFDEITMSTIAAGAGLAKGTLYLYFGSREEIFLALFVRELRAWLGSFKAATVLSSPEIALDWIAASLADRRELLRLSALLHNVLERNLSTTTAREFKLTLDAELSAAAPVVADVLRLADTQAARQFLRWLQVCSVGLSQMAFPAAAVQAAIAEERRLAYMAIDFGTEMRSMLAALLSGLCRKDSEYGK